MYSLMKYFAKFLRYCSMWHPFGENYAALMDRLVTDSNEQIGVFVPSFSK